MRGIGEQRLRDGLAREHRYLPFRSLFGKPLRHVAVWGEIRVALPGWTAGAFKVGARNAWIGWSPDQRFSRLHPVANKSRFAVPAERGRFPNRASRILAPGLRRLSSGMRERHGFPVLPAETFVDPSRFEGICYRASNWRRLSEFNYAPKFRLSKSRALIEERALQTRLSLLSPDRYSRYRAASVYSGAWPSSPPLPSRSSRSKTGPESRRSHRTRFGDLRTAGEKPHSTV